MWRERATDNGFARARSGKGDCSSSGYGGRLPPADHRLVPGVVRLSLGGDPVAGVVLPAVSPRFEHARRSPARDAERLRVLAGVVDQERRPAALRIEAEQYGWRVENGGKYYMMLCPWTPSNPRYELDNEKRFATLADALYDLDGSDPEISDTALGAALTEGRAAATMMVEAADPVAVAAQSLVHGTSRHPHGRRFHPGWKETRVLASDRQRPPQTVAHRV